MEEAWPIGVFFFVSVGSCLLTRGLVLESFDNLTSNTSKLLFILFFGLQVYFICFAIRNRVIVHSVSVVLALGTLVESGEVTIPLVSLYSMFHQEVR